MKRNIKTRMNENHISLSNQAVWKKGIAPGEFYVFMAGYNTGKSMLATMIKDRNIFHNVWDSDET